MRIEIYKIEDIEVESKDSAKFNLKLAEEYISCSPYEGHNEKFKKIYEWAKYGVNTHYAKSENVSELKAWIKDHFVGRSDVFYLFFIEKDEDLMLFKLRWLE